RFDEVVDVPFLEETVVIKTGIDEDIVAVAADEPDHHGDIEFAGRVSACDQFSDRKVREGGVTDGVDLVLRFRLSGYGNDCQRCDDQTQKNAMEAHEEFLSIVEAAIFARGMPVFSGKLRVGSE